MTIVENSYFIVLSVILGINIFLSESPIFGLMCDQHAWNIRVFQIGHGSL